MSANSALAPQKFYEPYRLQVFALVAEATGLIDDVTALVTSYAIQLDLFGSAEWKRYFNQDVGEEPHLPDAFWKFWHSPDPVNAAQKVWETHLPPVLRPEFVIDRDTHVRKEFCLNVMGELIQNPKEGHASKYTQYRMPDTDTFLQHGNIKAGPACWLVMRKNAFGRDQPYAQQIQVVNNLKAGYEAGPSAIDIVTLVFTRFVVTQERYLGNDMGIEACWTYSRCTEMVKLGEREFRLVVGGHSLGEGGVPCGLHVGYFWYGDEHLTVVGLRKFPGA